MTYYEMVIEEADSYPWDLYQALEAWSYAAFALFNIGDYEKAGSYASKGEEFLMRMEKEFHESIELFVQCAADIKIAQGYANLCTDNFQESVNAFIKSLEYIELYKKTLTEQSDIDSLQRNTINVCNHIAVAYLCLKDYGNAEIYLSKFSESDNVNAEQWIWYLSKNELEYQKGNLNSAREFFSQYPEHAGEFVPDDVLKANIGFVNDEKFLKDCID